MSQLLGKKRGLLDLSDRPAIPQVFNYTSLRSICSLSKARDIQEREKSEYSSKLLEDPLKRYHCYQTNLQRGHQLCYIAIDGFAEGEVPDTKTLERLLEIGKQYHYFIPSIGYQCNNQRPPKKRIIEKSKVIAYDTAIPVDVEDIIPEDAKTVDIQTLEVQDDKADWEKAKERADKQFTKLFDNFWKNEEANLAARPQKKFAAFKPIFPSQENNITAIFGSGTQIGSGENSISVFNKPAQESLTNVFNKPFKPLFASQAEAMKKESLAPQDVFNKPFKPLFANQAEALKKSHSTGGTLPSFQSLTSTSIIKNNSDELSVSITSGVSSSFQSVSSASSGFSSFKPVGSGSSSFQSVSSTPSGLSSFQPVGSGSSSFQSVSNTPSGLSSFQPVVQSKEQKLEYSEEENENEKIACGEAPF